MIHDQRITAAIVSLIVAVIVYSHPTMDTPSVTSAVGVVLAAVVSLFTRVPGTPAAPPPGVK